MNETLYQINFLAEEEGGYTATVPALPGCISYGENIEEATKNIKEAIELHLENLAAHHKDNNQTYRPSYISMVSVNLPQYGHKVTCR